jgi:hypothetical protein
MRWFKLVAVAAVLAALISAGMLAVGDQLKPPAPTVAMCAGQGGCGGSCGGECAAGAHANGCPVSHAKVAKHATSTAKAQVCPKSAKGQTCDPATCKDCTVSAKAQVCPKSEKGQICDPATCKDCARPAKAASGHGTAPAAKPHKA